MFNSSAFKSNCFVLNHKEKKWVKLDDCIWYGLDCIKLSTKLASLYPDYKKLFFEYLQVGNSTPKPLLANSKV